MQKNVFFSFLIKILSILISFVLVPLTIDFVNPVQYGIWLTISSIVAWFSFFDIGFTNGLRNRLAEAFAVGDIVRARKYISTTYAMLSIIFISLMVVVVCFLPYLNITKLLKIDSALTQDVQYASILVVCYFCMTFILKVINFVLLADQQPAVSSLIDMLGQALALLVIWLLSHVISEGSITILALGLCIPPTVILVIATVYMFVKPYKHLRPSVFYIDFSYVKDLLELGIQFFIIQIAAVVQFQTSNFIIARFYSMEDVTAFNIAYKYFGIIYMVFMAVLQPFWSAVTDAYCKNDFHWIKKMIWKYCFLFLVLAVIGGGMLIISNPVYDFWLGEKNRIDIPFSVSLWMYIYYCVMMLGAIFVYFVNGIGALRIQLISSLISPIFFILMAVLLCKYLHWSVYAILVASIISNFNGIILAPLQYFKVITFSKGKIWRA